MVDCSVSGTNRQACLRVPANELSVPNTWPSPSQMTRMLSKKLRSTSDVVSYNTADSSCCVSSKVKTSARFLAVFLSVTFPFSMAFFRARVYTTDICLRAAALSDFTVTVRINCNVSLSADICW